MKKRIYWLDNLRALAIILVVIGHFAKEIAVKNELWNNIVNYIYSFHMPLFFVLSGITHSMSKRKEFKPFVKDKFKKLLIPYFILNLLVMPIWLAIDLFILKNENPFWLVSVGVIYSNQIAIQMISNVTWFISFMFFLSISFYLIESLSKKDKRIKHIIVLIITIIGIIFSIFKINAAGLPYHLFTLIYAIPFFYLGTIYQTYEEKINNFIKSKLLNYILAILLIGVGLWLGLKNGKVSMHANQYGNVYTFFVSAICTILGLILLFRHTPKISPLIFLSTNSMIYAAFHCPIRRIFLSIPSTNPLTVNYPITSTILIILIIIPIALLVNKFIPIAVGKNKK